jgi:SulP family sulfate permease
MKPLNPRNSLNPRLEAWLPQSVLCLRDYSLSKFTADLTAGVTVGFVALPLAMAFAISSGLLPQAGLYCAVVTGFLISALGGSRLQVGGPTGAFVVVVAGILAKHGLNGLFLCTMMAGVLLILLGAMGLGSAVKFLPRPVIVGFTNGIAVLIASTQIKDFFGLKIASVPGEFLPRLIALARVFPTLNAPTTALASVSLLCLILIARYARRVPGSIVVTLTATFLVAMLHLPVVTIGSRFGSIPTGFPAPHIPPFHAEMIPALLPSALTIAMLCAIESLMSAVVADRMSGGRHNPNVELIGQGIANVVSPLFGGLPATGAIARTATNIRSGAQTPVAGMVHALTLLLVLLVAAPLARFIPLAALSAILLMVSYNMGEWKEIPHLLRMPKADIAVWIVTFGLTVFADLTVAVEAGMILAALLFIRRVAATTSINEVDEEYLEAGRVHNLQDRNIPDYVTIFGVHGPLLFGSSDKLEQIVGRVDKLPPLIVLRLRNMTALDATGLLAIQDLADKLHKTGRTLILCGARKQPANLMHQADFARHVGAENICPNLEAALARVHRFQVEETSAPGAVPTT